MDLIERLFGISPDGADGSLEALCLVAFIAVIAAVVFRRGLRRWEAARAPMSKEGLPRRNVRFV
jgi:hypothetical protein